MLELIMSYVVTFDSLNSLRPANASFGEVVSIDLFLKGKHLGGSKRKSIHVPASSNAYWNWMTLRSVVTRSFRENPELTGDDRQVVRKLLKGLVKWIHESELKLTYFSDLAPVQYYEIHFERLGRAHFLARVYRAGDREDFCDPIHITWAAIS
jgi:hypothetical protein